MLKNEIGLILKKRIDYIESIQNGIESGEIKIEDLVFVDEAGSKLGMSSNYARAEGGKRAVAFEPKNTGKNITIVGALGIYGVIAVMYCLCTLNGSGFLTYIEKYLVPCLRPGQIVIMDNVNFHCSSEVEKAIEQAGCTLVFLPPYSPELNPIENMWSKIKAYLKSKMPKTLSDYHVALNEAFNEVTDDDCEGWFSNSDYIRC